MIITDNWLTLKLTSAMIVILAVIGSDPESVGDFTRTFVIWLSGIRCSPFRMWHDLKGLEIRQLQRRQ